jgi:N-acetylmuramoyl-L-alanine amidase
VTPEEFNTIAMAMAEARRRRGGPSPGEAHRLALALPSLLGDHPDAIEPLRTMLGLKECEILLQSDSPEYRKLLHTQLLSQLNSTFSASMLEKLEAFLNGLLSGYGLKGNYEEKTNSSGRKPGKSPQRDQWSEGPAQVAQPDIKSWLFGLATGALATLGLLYLGLLGTRQLGWDPLASENQHHQRITPKESAATSQSQAEPTIPVLPRKTIPQVQAVPSQSMLDLTSGQTTLLQACAIKLERVGEIQKPADSTNYGPRLKNNWNGEAIPNQPQLIVLHETVIGQEATIKAFQSHHPNDSDQASYHVLIGSRGERIRLVPDNDRAYGAGDSAFGDYTIQARQGSDPSINNVALHVSLVTPADGQGNDERDSHSGYSAAQYRGLAEQVLIWQGLYGIPMSRVTTHAAVDRSHSRYDPRSFRWDRFDAAYKATKRECG